MSALSPLASVPTGTNRILHVDDEVAFTDLTAAFLEREEDDFDVETATSVEEGLARLSAEDFDCVISDYDMPDRNGIEFLDAVRGLDADLPFILFTGKGSEEIASDAISAGVTEYLQKEGGTDQYTVLANRVRNAIEHHRSRRTVERSEKRLREIVDSVPQVLYVVDEDGQYLLANEALAAFHGTTVDDIEGSSVASVLGEEVAAGFQEHLDEVLDSESREQFSEVEVPDADGDIHVLDSRLIPYDLGGAEKRAALGVATDVTERKERERELERYEAYLEESNDIVTVLDASGTIKYESPSIARILGYEPGELVGEDGFEFVHPEDVEEVRSAFADIVAEPGATTTVECRFRTADGEWRWLEVRGRNQLEHEAVEGVVTNNRDITERKQHERELERTSELLSRTERIADVAGWEIDPETEDVFWTGNLFSLLGLDIEEEPPLERALDVYHEDDRATVESAVEEALATGESFDIEVRFRRPDGEVRWLRVQGVPTLEAGDVTALRGAVQDITEQRAHKRELEQARTDYEELFNGMNDTAWVIGEDETFLAVNDAAVETTGYTREALLSMKPHDIDASLAPGEITSLIDDIPEDEIQVFETVHETASGESIPVEISSSQITYRGESAVLSVARDISERKRREQQRERLASIVSHDLRNPLAVAEGHLELAREDCDTEHLERVARAHARMDTLIEDLLVLAREGEAERELVGLGPLVKDCWANIETDSATLRNTAEGTVRADRSRLQQLFENLIRNSVEHGSTSNWTESGDSVEHGSTGSRAEPDDSVEHSFTSNRTESGDSAASDVTVTVGRLDDGFYVEDDGPGIPADEREEVFDFGYSTAATGTGFGLSIVKQVVEEHGWDVRCVEGTDGGARFEITGVEFGP